MVVLDRRVNLGTQEPLVRAFLVQREKLGHRGFLGIGD